MWFKNWRARKPGAGSLSDASPNFRPAVEASELVFFLSLAIFFLQAHLEHSIIVPAAPKGETCFSFCRAYVNGP